MKDWMILLFAYAACYWPVVALMGELEWSRTVKLISVAALIAVPAAVLLLRRARGSKGVRRAEVD